MPNHKNDYPILEYDTEKVAGIDSMIDRNLIIYELTKVLLPLSFINAFWLEGADANDTVDEYSDIDFWVDFDDEFEDSAYKAVEAALASISAIDYKYVMSHDHPKIRQRIYHLENTSEYLMIDFCWQLQSRPRDEFTYIENDRIEAVKVLFDKNNVIRYKTLTLSDYAQYNDHRLNEAKYRRTQYMRAEKYVKRGQYLEAYAYYNRYVLEPVIDLLRLFHTPAHSDYYLVHLSKHIPEADRVRLEYLTQIGSLDDISAKIPMAGEWCDEMIEKIDGVK